MARAARPSDVYRLPEQTLPARRPVEPPDDPPPSGRRIPAWLWVAVGLAVVLVVSGLAGGAGAPPTSGDAPLVDIISEDQAIAALALYGAQVDSIRELRDHREIFDGGGAPAAAAAAGRGAANVQQRLDNARQVNNPDPLFTAYVASGSHVATQARLNAGRDIAQTLNLFAATHDSLYGGTGAIGLDEAHTRIQAAMDGTAPGPVKRWGGALLNQIENRPAVNDALAGREECAQYWASLVDLVEPAAVPELQTYISGLPAATVEGLRGHPVAGPALETLEETSRQVSRGTTSPSGRH